MSPPVDLMPPTCRQVFGRRARIRRWVGMYVGAACIVLGTSWFLGIGRESRQRERESLARQVELAWSRNEEAQRLLAEIERVNADIVLYDRLAWPIGAADVIACVGEAMPEGLFLTAMTMTPREDRVRSAPRERSQKKAASGKEKPRERRVLGIELEGIAPTDIALSQFVSSLDQHPLFERVALDYARSRHVDGVEARGFRLTCEIELSERYERVAEATPEPGESPVPVAEGSEAW